MEKISNDRKKTTWINLIFLIITLVVNGLGSAGFINGYSQQEVSDMYTTLITPSSSTFSIWGLIYGLLFISLIVMIVKRDKSYYQRAIDEITILFRISCILNIAWIVLFSFLLLELSVVAILGFVIVLSLLLKRLTKINDGKHFLLPLTFGIYTGWLLIATVVNISATLVKIDWNGFGISSEIWAIITLAVSIVLVFVVLMSNRNAVFPLPLAWAYFGIYQNLVAPEGFNGQYGLLQTASLVGMAILIGMAAIQLYKNQFALLPKPAKY